MRDQLLGRPNPSDLDLVIGPESGANHLASEDLVQTLAESKLLDRPAVLYAQFGTAMIEISGTKIEIVAARKESYRGESRKPTVKAATLLDDAQRRDFTVNALLLGLHGQGLRDPLGKGIPDLEAKLLRTPLDPSLTFPEDPLRMLRAVRFRWQLGFEPAPGLNEAITLEAGRLAIVSAERIREEFEKMLATPDADRALQDLMVLGLLDVFAPEFRPMLSVGQGGHHHLDVWHHSLLVVRNAGPGNLVLTLAALLHDIGKPSTACQEPDGGVRFFGHESIGAAMATSLLERLKFPSDVVQRVARLVRNHMRLGSSPIFTPSAARRVLRDLDEDTELLLRLVEADAASLRPGVRALNLNPIREQIDSVRLATPRQVLESPLSGDQIMEALSLGPGPEVGLAKAWLLDQVLEGQILPGDQEKSREKLRKVWPLTK